MATLRAAGHEAGVGHDEDDYAEDYEKVLGADAGAEAFFVQRGRGAIYISDNGCGTTSWLVVAGPHGGEIIVSHEDLGMMSEIEIVRP